MILKAISLYVLCPIVKDDLAHENLVAFLQVVRYY
jgi:hypothetical protein